MIVRQLVTAFVLLGCVTMAYTAHAANPDYRVPEKVDHQMKPCQDLAAIAQKYKIEAVFPKEFAEGKQCFTRVELAAALQVVTEQLAERVVKEGGDSVAKADLETLADIREELRAEMLLVGTRTFQQRNELLGTLLHPLTKSISMSGQLVGVLQSTAGLRNGDHSGFSGRGDLVFNFRVGEHTTAVIDLDALTGDGIDATVASFSGLNGVAGSTGSMARFRQAWVEQTLFDERLVGTVGKIDLANYFDTNAVANDENSQFLAGAFVNAHILAVPDIGPGARVAARLGDAVQIGVAYASGDATGNEFFRNGFGIAEMGIKTKVGALEGNYRLYGAIDGALPDATVKFSRKNAFNAGISIDQQLTDRLTVFGRYGERERSVYLTSRSWSAGVQYAGLIPDRGDDVVGIAYGQIAGKGLDSQEKLVEGYYTVKVSEKFSIAPVAQCLINPQGVKSADDVVTLGLRSLVSF
jgi:hypothetical protein